MPDTILIAGGGFAGFWAALAAKRVAGDRATVTVLSREPVLQMRPRLYEAVPETLGVDIIPHLQAAGVCFVQGEAVGLDIPGRSLMLASGDLLPYSRLIVATGSVMRRPPVPGAADAWSIDTQQEAVAFDARLAQVARTVSDPTLVVVGAGFTGIELALELRDRIATHGETDAGERARIVLIDRAAEVGHELGPGPRPVIEAALNAARVERLLGVTVSAIDPDRVTLAGGTVIPCEAVVLATGMVAAPFVAHVPGERDALGRVITSTSLQAPAAPDVFVTGDAVAVDAGDGERALQSCQHALQLGRFAGENAARDLLGLPLLAYSQPRYVTCLDLGRAGAVFTTGRERTVVATGPEAKARKRRINTQVIYPPEGVDGEALLAMSVTRAD